MSTPLDLDSLSYDKERKTVVVVAQDATTGRVLMVANADREALERTIETGEMHYRSRTRGLWRKGATSGNVQQLVSLTADCDADTVLARVVSAGPACHTGAVSCFAEPADASNVWSALAATISARNAAVKAKSTVEADTGTRDQSRSYTRKLLLDRNLRLKKIGEESAELIAACADGDRSRSTAEAADLIYHVAVALEAIGSSLNDVAEVLLERSMAAAASSVST